MQYQLVSKVITASDKVVDQNLHFEGSEVDCRNEMKNIFGGISPEVAKSFGVIIEPVPYADVHQGR